MPSKYLGTGNVKFANTTVEIYIKRRFHNGTNSVQRNTGFAQVDQTRKQTLHGLFITVASILGFVSTWNMLFDKINIVVAVLFFLFLSAKQFRRRKSRARYHHDKSALEPFFHVILYIFFTRL